MTDSKKSLEAVFGKNFERDAHGQPIEKGTGNLTDRANPKPAVTWPSGYQHPPGSKTE